MLSFGALVCTAGGMRRSRCGHSKLGIARNRKDVFFLKTRGFVALALAVWLVVGALGGCGGASAGGAVALTDMTGREIKLDGPAEKVVAVSASDCEIIYALGAGDKMVGRGEYCDWPAEAAAVQVVSSGAETNVEQILALAPDVVFMNSMAQDEAQVKQIEDAGIAVVLSNAASIDETYTSIETIGKVLGKDKEAADLVRQMKDGFADITKKAGEQALEGKTVYFEVSPLEFGLWTAGSGTFMDEIAAMLGLTNIFADVDGWAEVSEEQVIERNPDYIFTVGMYFGEGPEPDDEIVLRSGWENIAAVKDGHVFMANADELSRPGPRLADGANALYGYVYGAES